MKIDKLKEQIGWLKVTYGITFATDISLIAWIFNNFDNISLVKLNISLVSTFIITIIVFLSNKKANDKMNQLEDL